jgi:hypothetical protein
VGSIVHAKTGEVITPDESIEDPEKRAKAFALAANRGRLGHARELRGTVWGQPPYGFPAPFVRAIVEGFIGQTVEEAEEDFESRHASVDPQQRRAQALARAAANGGGFEISEAILLLNAATATEIGQILLAVSKAICWPAKRVAYLDHEGKPQDSNRADPLIYYLGTNPRRFVEEYSQFGVCGWLFGRMS